MVSPQCPGLRGGVGVWCRRVGALPMSRCRRRRPRSVFFFNVNVNTNVNLIRFILIEDPFRKSRSRLRHLNQVRLFGSG